MSTVETVTPAHLQLRELFEKSAIGSKDNEAAGVALTILNGMESTLSQTDNYTLDFITTHQALEAKKLLESIPSYAKIPGSERILWGQVCAGWLATLDKEAELSLIRFLLGTSSLVCYHLQFILEALRGSLREGDNNTLSKIEALVSEATINNREIVELVAHAYVRIVGFDQLKEMFSRRKSA